MHALALTWVLVLSQTPAAAASTVPELAGYQALWLKRDDPQVLKQVTAMADQAVKAHPDSFEALWRKAQLDQWLADEGQDKDYLARMGKEAWRYGDLATAKSPKDVQGPYYAALGIGEYSLAVGILHALSEGLESKFKDRLNRALMTDTSWQVGGGLVAQGRFYYELPWPKRDLGKSRAILEQVTTQYPENLRGWLYLAETLLKDDKPKEAQAALEHVKTGGVDYDPPEGRRVKRWAQRVDAKIQAALR